jgi:hypothetical protein
MHGMISVSTGQKIFTAPILKPIPNRIGHGQPVQLCLGTVNSLLVVFDLLFDNLTFFAHFLAPFK